MTTTTQQNGSAPRVFASRYKGFCGRRDGGCGKRWGDGDGERVGKVETPTGAWYFCEACARKLSAVPVAQRVGPRPDGAIPAVDTRAPGDRARATSGWVASLAAFVLSALQAAFLTAVRDKRQHLILSACAGSGKTTTIKLAFARVPSAVLGSALVLAYNVKIKDELADALADAPGSPQVRTVHGAGFSLALIPAFKAKTGRDLGRSAVDFGLASKVYRRLWPTDTDDVADSVAYRNRDLLGPVVRLTDLTRCTLSDDLPALVARHNIDLNGAADDLVEVFERVGDLVAELEAVFWRDGQVDGAGMVYLPVALDLTPRETFRTVFVDECQDLSRARVALALRLAGKTGRVVAVGDERQAIYGFSGADTEAVTNLRATLAATSRGVADLDLDVCRRCPTSVIDLVRRLDLHPTIKALPGAPKGEVASASLDSWLDGVDGDLDTLALSRRNVDLVAPAFRLIRRGVPCRIQGRDIGAGIRALAKRCAWKRDGGDLAKLGERLDAYVERTVRKLLALGHEAQVESLRDRAATVQAIALGDKVETVADLLAQVTEMFQDTGNERVVFSTVHKAKGLEADTVYILRPDLIPGPWATQDWERVQERNLQYVAYTRAKRRLLFVGDLPDGDGDEVSDDSYPTTEEREEREERKVADVRQPAAGPVALAALPVLPSKGKRGAVEATLAEWETVRDLYQAAGCRAELRDDIGKGTRFAWKQIALLVGNDDGPAVRVSTTIDVRNGRARAKDANAIDIARVDTADGPPLEGSKRKCLRTLNWQGRVVAKVNAILKDAGLAE